MRRLSDRIAKPVRIAFLGEHGAGKSALINVLLRRRVIPERSLGSQKPKLLIRYGTYEAAYLTQPDGLRNALPYEAAIEALKGDLDQPRANPRVIYRSGSAPPEDEQGRSIPGGNNFIEIEQPLEALKSMDVLEIAAESAVTWDRMTARCLVRLDMIFWVTPATNAWKKSELLAWSRVVSRQATRTLLIVTGMDLLHSETEKTKLLARLDKEAAPLFSSRALVSSSEAMRLLQNPTSNSPFKWERTGMTELERWLSQAGDDVYLRRAEKARETSTRLARFAAERRKGAESPRG